MSLLCSIIRECPITCHISEIIKQQSIDFMIVSGVYIELRREGRIITFSGS